MHASLWPKYEEARRELEVGAMPTDEILIHAHVHAYAYVHTYTRTYAYVHAYMRTYVHAQALTEGGGLPARMAAELKACHEREARATSALQKLRISLAQALAPLAPATPRPFSPAPPPSDLAGGAAVAMASSLAARGGGAGGKKSAEGGGSCTQLVMRVAQLATAHVDAIQTVRGTVIELHEASIQMSDLGETMETRSEAHTHNACTLLACSHLHASR